MSALHGLPRTERLRDQGCPISDQTCLTLLVLYYTPLSLSLFPWICKEFFMNLFFVIRWTYFDVIQPCRLSANGRQTPTNRTKGKKRKWAKIGADRAARAAGSCATSNVPPGIFRRQMWLKIVPWDILVFVILPLADDARPSAMGLRWKVGFAESAFVPVLAPFSRDNRPWAKL